MTATAICTDSSAQLPARLVARLRAEVVPLSIAVDDRLFDEPDVGADDFYRWLAAGRRITTSQPSPGRFATAYEHAAARGAHDVLSVHVGSAFSGTVGSAELAAREAPLPVTVVDTGTASFGVGICVIAAAEVIAAGGSAEAAADAIERLVPAIGSVFTAAPAEGGRIAAGDGVQVLSLVDGVMETLRPVADAVDAAAVMATHLSSVPGPLRVAVGHADASVADAAGRLAATLAGSGAVREVVRYRVGPSVGAHTGGSSFGAFWWPACSHVASSGS